HALLEVRARQLVAEPRRSARVRPGGSQAGCRRRLEPGVVGVLTVPAIVCAVPGTHGRGNTTRAVQHGVMLKGAGMRRFRGPTRQASREKWDALSCVRPR